MTLAVDSRRAGNDKLTKDMEAGGPTDVEDLIEGLVRLLADRRIVFSGQDAAHRAQEVQRYQNNAYNRLQEELQKISVPRTGGEPFRFVRGNAFEAVMSWVRAIVSRQPATMHTQPTGAAVVEATFPVLVPEELDHFIARVGKSDFGNVTDAQASSAIVGALCVEFFSDEQRFNIDSVQGPSKGELITGQALYSAGKIISTHRGLDERFREKVAGAEGVLANAAAEFAKERKSQRSALDALVASVTDITARTEDAQASIERTRDDLLNFEKTIRAELELDRARLNWGVRYDEARVSFKIAVILLSVWTIVGLVAAVVFAPGAIDYIYRPSLYALLPNGAVAAIGAQLGRLVLVTFVVGIYLWVMRIGVRYFMRSMLLMDDARQRETMLDTYFVLSSTGRADEADRPLILWSLFRQTPGHGPDGIEPPDFTEVITAGMKRAGLDRGVGN